MSDPIPSDLVAALKSARGRLDPGSALHYFAEVDSTNDIALTLASRGAADGTAVLADAQRSGRGRRGRAWFSPPGAGIYLSVVVRSERIPASGALLTLAAGVAAAESLIALTGLPIELKWPNDLVVGRPWRKVAGILCESAGTGGRLDAVVVGIGINVQAAAYPAELRDRATALELETGRPVDRAAVVVECLAGLRAVIESLRREGRGERDAVLPRWRRLASATLDRRAVRWSDAGGERRGLASAVDEDGALLVETAAGLERIVAGEVTWDPMI